MYFLLLNRFYIFCKNWPQGKFVLCKCTRKVRSFVRSVTEWQCHKSNDPIKSAVLSKRAALGSQRYSVIALSGSLWPSNIVTYDNATVGQRNSVAIWPCDRMTRQWDRLTCDSVTVWQLDRVTAWHCVGVASSAWAPRGRSGRRGGRSAAGCRGTPSLRGTGASGWTSASHGSGIIYKNI